MEKQTWWREAVVVVSILLFPLTAQTQKVPRHDAPVAAYDRAHEITVDGSVQKLISNPAPGSPRGLHLLMDTPGGSVDAHLGLLNEQQASRIGLIPGAAVHIVGTMIGVGGAEYLAARKLTVGNHTLTLRNERGFPLFQVAPRTSAGKIILRRNRP
ncbi:MAG TPA: hypothetical protein VJ731_15210 [Terriglobales bacterium]|nr:hypothetical protein [Terriglobales bacterium]